jgi:hypothetical protein
MPKQVSKTRRKLEKVAKRVNKATGATNLSKYIGESIAKRKNPAVKRTVTGAQARKSGARLAGTIAGLAAGGAAGGAAKAANKAKKLKAAKAVAKTRKADKRSNAFIKRTYSGHEKAAMRAAAKRNAAKRKK